MAKAKSITVFGATGSIGQSALALVRQFPETFSVHGLIAGSDAMGLAKLAREFSPQIVGINDPAKYAELSALLADTDIEIVAGQGACTAIATVKVDLVIAGIIGLAGLPSVMAAVDAGQTIGLANKESLVSAGALVTRRATESGAHILPLDSEHNAIFQCWNGWKGHRGVHDTQEELADIQRICLTASGGPFLTLKLDDFSNIQPADALKHPNWTMGRKISIDSATMMNKGLEVIEAHWLFSVAPEMISVMIHPQQAIHGMVYFRDGSVIAQLGGADMRTPISYAMAWPERLPWAEQALDLVTMRQLEFMDVDAKRFPCFALARAALIADGVYPAVLNAANEIAVEAFLDGRITFPTIAMVVEDCLGSGISGDLESLDAVLDVDAAARKVAHDRVAKRQLS